MSSHTRMRGRALLRFTLLLLVPLIGGALGVRWYAHAQRFVVTDNAYVRSNITAVSASIDGRVTAVHVADNQRVERGALLLELDPRPHRINIERAHARIAAFRNEFESMRAQHAQVSAQIADAEERLAYFRRQHERQQGLATKGVAIQATIDEAEYQVSQAAQQLLGLRERANEVIAELGGGGVASPEQHPRYLEAAASLAEAELAMEYTRVRAPVAGRVSRVKLRAGQWIETGDTVFSLIEDDMVWVEANVKETQLTDLANGLPVRIEVDAYPGVEWRGRLDSIASATGSEFLLLPAQNATGNWVKVVQRVPVRIELDDERPTLALRAGMTVAVSIDTGREHDPFALVREAVAAIGGQ